MQYNDRWEPKTQKAQASMYQMKWQITYLCQAKLTTTTIIKWYSKKAKKRKQVIT